MKKIFIAVLTLATFSVHAQNGGQAPKANNSLLNQNFWKGNVDVATVKAEVEKGNNPAEQNAASYDPVSLAINNNAPNATILYLLEQKGNDVNKLTHDGRIYLTWAAARGNIEIMEHLIKKGSDVNFKDNKGASPLIFAASGGQKNPKVYDLLIANGADLKKDANPDGANAILLAAANDNDFKITEYFISKGLSLNDVDSYGNTAFNYAAKSGNIEQMKNLLQKGIKPTQNAMAMAAQGGRGAATKLEVYQYLETVGIKPSALGVNGESALAYIVRKPNQEEIIAYFLSKGVDVNSAGKDGNTVFMAAAEANNDIKIISNLLKSVKNKNHKNANGASALALAAASNSAEVIQLLLDNGADVNSVDSKGDNILAYLIQGYGPNRAKDFDAKLNLLTQKLDAKVAQKNGNTLYHLAVAKNDLNLVKKIEPFKIDLNLKNSEGFTALHKAALIARNADVLKYLVDLGADKKIQSEFDETAFDLAKENENLSKTGINIEFLK